jgi:hypothetical protein
MRKARFIKNNVIILFASLLAVCIFGVHTISAASLFRRRQENEYAVANTYFNKEYNIQISKPSTWYFIYGEKLNNSAKAGRSRITHGDILSKNEDEGRRNIVGIYKYKKGKLGVLINPAVVISTIEIGTDFDYTIPEFLSNTITQFKVYIKDFELMEGPDFAVLNGRKWGRILYRGKIVVGYLDIAIIQEIFAYKQGNSIFLLSVVDTEDGYKKDKGQLYNIMDSLKLGARSNSK